MAQIGIFTRGEDGTLSGTIRTLSLNVKARFVPTEPSSNEKAPALRVFAGPVEIGAAWKRTSKDNAVYHSVKLDDPFFPAPIFVSDIPARSKNSVSVAPGMRQVTVTPESLISLRSAHETESIKALVPL